MAGFAEINVAQNPCTYSGGDFASGRWDDFRSELLREPGKNEVKLSDCRDLIEVPGEPEWKLRRLAEAFPQYCWKYAEPEVIAHYHYNVATTADAPARQSDATLPVFYAHLPNSFSPYDFSVQPKSLNRARERLYRQMQITYSNADNDFDVSYDQMCAGAACAVLTMDKRWLRARIMKFGKGNGALVDLVDVGNENIVTKKSLRPLLKPFGRLPPLAMRCRMKDVSMNDLSAEKVHVFQQLIIACGGLVRVELADVSSVPYLVNLYHPTVQGRNLGSLFYRRRQNAEHEAARQRRWNERLARMNGDFTSDEMEEESIEENVHAQPTHVLHLERIQKTIADEPLYVSHIENRRFIYLHSAYHKRRIENLEKLLFEKWSELEIIPETWLEPGVACAYYGIPECINPCRVIIAEVKNRTVWIRAADYGWKRCLLKDDCLSGGILRAMTREFSDSPLVYLCRLPSSMQFHPHRSETDILRMILPVGTSVNVHCYRSRRALPTKADICYQKSDESVLEILEHLKAEKHVLHPCFDLLPYKPWTYSALSQQHQQPDCNYQEDLEIFQPFAKGRLKYANLP